MKYKNIINKKAKNLNIYSKKLNKSVIDINLQANLQYV